MKNSNNIQDRKFEIRVDHISSFIGMPIWNGCNPTLSEIREYDRRLLEKQAVGFKPNRKNILNRLFTMVSSMVSKAISQITRAGKKTKELQHEITNPIKTGSECCG